MVIFALLDTPFVIRIFQSIESNQDYKLIENIVTELINTISNLSINQIDKNIVIIIKRYSDKKLSE